MKIELFFTLIIFWNYFLKKIVKYNLKLTYYNFLFISVIFVKPIILLV